MERKDNNEGKRMGIEAEILREGYETSVASRMKGRSGASTKNGSAGIALEILANDRSNVKNILKPNTKTKLTKSPTAKQVDAVTMKDGKVVERIQYKDTVSRSGVKKTLDQVKSGKYRQAQLCGTIEASEKYNAAAKAKGVSKRMHSTGISHNTTKRVGDKFTHQLVSPESIGDALKSSVPLSVGITAGTEVVKSVADGDSVGECTGHVISKGAESALSTAAATVAAEATASVAGAALASSTIPIAGPLIAGVGAAALTGKVVSEITDGAFDDIGDTIGTVIDDVGDTIGTAIDDAGDYISCAIDDITDNILDGVVDIVGDVLSLFW